MSSRWVAGVTATTLVLGLVVVGVVKLWRYVDGPAQTPGKTLAAEQASAAPKPSVPPTSRLGGTYVELAYPGVFDQLAMVKTDAQALEQYSLSSKKSYRRSITVDVRPLPSGALSDDSNYRVRQLAPADYRETVVQLRGEAATVMIKADGHEQTLFWPHRGKLLIVAVTSTELGDDVASMMTTITAQARWQT